MRGDESGGKRWPAQRQMRDYDQWSNLPISRKIGQRQYTRGGNGRRERATADESREGNGGGREATKVEARGGSPNCRQEAIAALVVDERCVMGKR
jgi:hypothetical protein